MKPTQPNGKTTRTSKSIKARDGRGRATRSKQTIEQDVRAAELRSKSLTYRQIAAELGVSVATAHDMVMRGIREIPVDGAVEARQIELDKLDSVERAAWAILEAHHFVMIESGPKAGTIIYHPERPGEALADSGPALAAIDRIIKASESRRKLLGLDAPKQSIVNVITEDVVDAEIKRLEAELAGDEAELAGDDPSAA